MSLLELVLGGGLAVLVMSVVFLSWRVTAGITTELTTKAGLQQEAMVAADRMQSDLRRVCTGGLAVLPGVPPEGTGLACLRLIARESYVGQLRFEDRFTLYVWKVGGPLRRQLSEVSPGLGVPQPSELPSLAHAPAQPPTTLARCVASLELALAEGTCRLVLELQDVAVPSRRVSVQRVLYLLNHR